MTQHPDLFAALAAPFTDQEVKIKEVKNKDGKGTRRMPYITARVVMNRLDSVLGPENWFDRYVPGEKSVLCELTIRLPDGSTLTKSDAGGYAGMADSGDDDKSGFSDAFKRAAVKFGVARYLYGDGVPTFARAAPAKAPSPPVVSQASKPATNGHAPTAGKPRGQWGNGTAPAATPTATATLDAPATGKALWTWIKGQEQATGNRILVWANKWGVAKGFPSRIVDWSAPQVAAAFAAITSKLESLPEQEAPE